MDKLLRILISMSLLACSVTVSVAKDRVVLPEKGPVPVEEPNRGTEPKSGQGNTDSLPGSAEAPVPQARPNEEAQPTVQNVERPEPRESVGRHNAKNFTRASDIEAAKVDAQCRADLDKLGVKYEAQARLSDPAGCSVPHPISVSSLGNGIELDPPAVLNCAMTKAAASFAQDIISSTAKSVYGAELKAVANASAYVCRPRNGTTKLSEHAFGNALDMARFVLKNDTAIDVTATTDPKASEFLAKIRSAACGPFKTVLGPGSDADHATHLHFDLQPRRSGSTFCQ